MHCYFTQKMTVFFNTVDKIIILKKNLRFFNFIKLSVNSKKLFL